MQTVWKYPLAVEDTHNIMMPKGAKILCVQVQNDTVCLWAAVDSEAKHERRTIVIHGTGHPLFGDMGVVREYIGTFQLRRGELVFHVYEYR